MMGSRGEPSPQVAALVTLCELLELAKNADLPAQIAQLRDAEKAARTAFAALDKKTAELDARHRELVELATAGEIREKQTAARETACALREEKTAQQQASFDEQKAALAAQSQEVNDGTNLLVADQAAFAKAQLLHATEHEAKAKTLAEEATRRGLESEAVVQSMRAKAESDISDMRAKAQAQITAAQETLQAREDKIAAREEEMHRERARISALLQE